MRPHPEVLPGVKRVRYSAAMNWLDIVDAARTQATERGVRFDFMARRQLEAIIVGNQVTIIPKRKDIPDRLAGKILHHLGVDQ